MLAGHNFKAFASNFIFQKFPIFKGSGCEMKLLVKLLIENKPILWSI